MIMISFPPLPQVGGSRLSSPNTQLGLDEFKLKFRAQLVPFQSVPVQLGQALARGRSFYGGPRPQRPQQL